MQKLLDKLDKHIFPIFFVCFFSFLGYNLITPALTNYEFREGHPLPEINLESAVSGKQLLKQKPEKFIMHFFSSWCSICIENHVFLSQNNINEKVTIYGVAVRDEVSAVDKILNQHNNPFTDYAVDTQGIESVKLGIKAVPETIFIENNKVVYRTKGKILASAIDKFMNE